MSSRWLTEPANQVEADLAAALDEARARLPDEVTMRRLWSKVASPDLETPVRARWPWFVGGVVTSSALAVAVGIWVLPLLPGAHHDITVTVVPDDRAPNTPPMIEPAPPKLGDGSAVPKPSPKLEQAEANPAPAAPTPVGPPARVRTRAGQTRSLALRGGTAVKLAQSTLMTVTPQSDGIDRPALEKGDAAFSVPHQAPGHNFSVMAGPYRIVVIGTKFRLHVEGIKVAVAVDEGVVEVWRKHRLVRLATGEAWSSPYDRSGVPAEGSANGPAEPQVASPVPPPPAPPAPAPAPEPAVTAPPVAPAPAPDPMQQAKAALAAGDPNRALDFYRAAITRGGPTAENAEYEIGRVQRDRLHQSSDAIATWKRYRSSHPNGLLRVETDVSIIEALVASGDSSALSEANDFLRQHAESERRAEIARIAGDLYRERGDYAHALNAYQTALAASRTREVTEYASFQRAACLIAMGQVSGNVALEEYLRAWPHGRFSREANRLLQGSARTKTP
jgi:tetratricopeptide (TPR) repeat protein